METNERSIGEQLRQARESLRLSGRKAAHKAGISEARWRQIENGVQFRDGKPSPATTTPETLVRMARAVGIDPAALLTEAGMPLDAVERVPERPERATYSAEAPASSNPKVIDLSRFTERERELINTFISGLELGRKRG